MDVPLQNYEITRQKIQVKSRFFLYKNSFFLYVQINTSVRIILSKELQERIFQITTLLGRKSICEKKLQFYWQQQWLQQV